MLSLTTVKIIKTCNLYLFYFTLGLSIAVTGPALLDLQDLVDTDTQHIGLIYTARSSGYAIGSLGGGILFDLIKRKQFVLTFFNLASALTMLAIPWSRSIGILTVCMVGNGFCLGVIDTGANICCLRLWGKTNSGPIFQGLHFMFGLGGFVSPLIAAPFLGDYARDLPDVNLNGTFTVPHENSTQMGLLNDSLLSLPTVPKVTYAFTIIGVIEFLLTGSFLMMCIMSPLEDVSNEHSEEKVRKRSWPLILLIVSLAFTFVFMEMGVEVGYGQMLTTFAVKGPLQLSVTVGSYITSVFWASFTLGRLLSVFLAIKISNLTLIAFDIALSLLGAAIFLFLGSLYEWAVWLASVLLGVGLSSCFPAVFAWTDEYITVTNKIAASFTIGAGFGEMIIPYTISHFLEDTPQVISYVVAATTSCSALITILLFITFRSIKPKFNDDVLSEKPPLEICTNSNLKV